MNEIFVFVLGFLTAFIITRRHYLEKLTDNENQYQAIIKRYREWKG